MSMFNEDEIKSAKQSAELRMRLGFICTEDEMVEYEYMTRIGPPVPLAMVKHKRVSTPEQLKELYLQCLRENKTWEEIIEFIYDKDVEY